MNILKLLTAAILTACSVNSEQFVNRCCLPSEAYNKFAGKCSFKSNELTGEPFIFRHGEGSSEILVIPNQLVKQLNGPVKAEVKFKIHYDLPVCSEGSFVKSFCTASNASQCPEHMTPLRLTTRAELEVKKEYYSPKQFCIIGGEDKALEIRICNHGVIHPLVRISIYRYAMIICGLFIPITMAVHVFLWHRNIFNGWTLMTYCASLFFTFVFFAIKILVFDL